jgi:hypothetical protein
LIGYGASCRLISGFTLRPNEVLNSKRSFIFGLVTSSTVARARR